MSREYIGAETALPEYDLSVSSRDLDERRQRWEYERTHGKVVPAVEPHTFNSYDDERSGLIVSVDARGNIGRTIYADGVQGILPTSEGGVYSAQHGLINYIPRNDSAIKVVASEPLFNDLHSIRETSSGLLVASTGTDALFELETHNYAVCWSWAATGHGYERDSFGNRRIIDKEIDYRKLVYDTWLHTTHINSALEIDNHTVLATLFHQGEVISIDKETGKSSVVLSGLERPHALRRYEDKITLANTAAGLAIIASMRNDRLHVERTIRFPTRWLQDCQLIDGVWVAVDGEHSSVHFANPNGDCIAYDQFDTKWFLYEAAVIQ